MGCYILEKKPKLAMFISPIATWSLTHTLVKYTKAHSAFNVY